MRCVRSPRFALSILAAALAAVGTAGPVLAQSGEPERLPAGVDADTLVLGAGALGATMDVEGPTLSAGERIAAWVVEAAEVGNPAATGRPVPDAPAGAVIASFSGGPPFAWPSAPTVWTAPRSGRLAFGVNAIADHEVRGAARVAVVRLGPPESAPQRAFVPPVITLERASGGARVRYADRTGFGLAPSTLRFVVTTSRGVVYHLSSWTRPGARETVLPLPPPALSLPPGVHRLTATVLDHLGNTSTSGEIAFDAAQ